MHGISMGKYLITFVVIVIVVLAVGAAVGAIAGGIADYFLGTFAYWTFYGSLIGVGVSVVTAALWCLVKLF